MIFFFWSFISRFDYCYYIIIIIFFFFVHLGTEASTTFQLAFVLGKQRATSWGDQWNKAQVLGLFGRSMEQSTGTWVSVLIVSGFLCFGVPSWCSQHLSPLVAVGEKAPLLHHRQHYVIREHTYIWLAAFCLC
jgi:hypothetical protein